jgi:hypothetical protein
VFGLNATNFHACVDAQTVQDMIYLEEFRAFMSSHNRLYQSQEELLDRYDVFTDNHEYAIQRNAMNLSYKLSSSGPHSDRLLYEYMSILSPIEQNRLSVLMKSSRRVDYSIPLTAGTPS